MKTLLLIVLILPALSQIAGYNVLLNSNLTSTVVIDPPNNKVVSAFQNSQYPNILGTGAIWIMDNSSSTFSWNAGYTATFSAPFTTQCLKAYLVFTQDNLLVNAKLNGVFVANENSEYVQLALNCGSNTLTFQVKTWATGPAGLLFSVFQSISDCPTTCSLNTAGYFDPNTCQCQCTGNTQCTAPQSWAAYPTCACQCPDITCPEGYYMHTPNCKCQCKEKICPTGQVQDPSNCGCALPN